MSELATSARRVLEIAVGLAEVLRTVAGPGLLVLLDEVVDQFCVSSEFGILLNTCGGPSPADSIVSVPAPMTRSHKDCV